MLGTLLGGVLPEQFRSSMLKPAIAQTPSQVHHNWVVLYWMPYDNDLSRFGEPIVEMLTRGIASLNPSNLPLEAAYNSSDNSSTTNDPDIASDIAVILQSDYRKDKHMRRRVFSQSQVQEIAIAGEDSSDVNALTNYLDWARQNFIADHWVVIVVGHGGKINEISPDYHGDSSLGNPPQPHTWMGVDQFTRAVANFNQSIGERVELLFFQNCHKAILEVIYEARNCARYTLASQLELGAPNYYYEGFLGKLKDMTGVGIDQGLPYGRQAAMAIIAAERADIYHTFTLVENRFVEQIPEKLAKVVASIPEGATVSLSLLALRRNIDTYEYFGERHCDALVLLNYLFRNHRTNDQKALQEFTEFLYSSAQGVTEGL
jgi:Clostripain family